MGMRIKERPEDFIVEEITPTGHVLEAGESPQWEKGEGDYLIFVMEKKNWNTMGALSEIAKRAHVSKKRLGFAGTKDRRAVTVQRASIWQVKKEQLEKLRIRDITLKPMCYTGEQVHLGDLQGNRFTITIRDVEALGEPGRVPNFFGVQRFGESRPMTHLVGKALVNEQYKKAVEIYLWKSFPTEQEENRKARARLAKERDFSAALAYFPKYLRYERTLLGHLAKSPEDFVGALNALPNKLLLMFTHAYQSQLFNQVLQKRLEIGLDPIEGDLLEDGVPTGPLYGSELELAKGRQGEIERGVLEGEWLGLEDFQLHGMPHLSSKGIRRSLYFELEGFQILERGEGWVKVRFSLQKGVYATTAINHLCGEPTAPLL